MNDQPPDQTSETSERAIHKDMTRMPLRKASNFVSVYANNVNFVTTPWDFELLFGQTVPEDPNDIHIEIQATIRLSPQMAKALVVTLSQNVRAYEQQYGEIRYTPVQPQTEEPSA